MPIINQFLPATSGYKGPAEQLLYASLIGFPGPGVGGGSSLKHTSAEGFVYGRSAPNDAIGEGYCDLYRFSIVVQGTGIGYDTNGLPVSGTITSISITNGTGTVLPGNQFVFQPMLTIGGLSMDVASLADELFQAFQGDPVPLQAYFDTLPWFHSGSSGVDAFTGGVLDDVIQGNAGNDSLQGGAGDDKLFGGADNDVLTGGAGADHLSGSSGIDTARYADAAAGVTVSLANASLNTGEAAGDTFESIENLTGSGFGDKLSGNFRNNILAGGDGNDTLTGAAGADTLDGGAGTDVASYAGAAAGVVASLANKAANTGDAAGDINLSIENLIGSGFADVLNGDNVVNVINGGAGNDIIKGDGGNDILKGGSGNDFFTFNSALDAVGNVDTIIDFDVAADTIRLDDAIFTALTAGALPASAFKDTADGPKDADDRIIYNSATGNLYYDADGSGAAFGNVKFASLTGAPALAASDFVVI